MNQKQEYLVMSHEKLANEAMQSLLNYFSMKKLKDQYKEKMLFYKEENELLKQELKEQDRELRRSKTDLLKKQKLYKSE